MEGVGWLDFDSVGVDVGVVMTGFLPNPGAFD